MNDRAKLFLTLLATVALLHGLSLAGGFVWDDHVLIEDNPSIRNLGNVPSFFTRNYFGAEADSELYRPRWPEVASLRHVKLSGHPRLKALLASFSHAEAFAGFVADSPDELQHLVGATDEPVTAKVFEALLMVIVRSRIPGSVAIGMCSAPSYVMCSYTSSVTA